MSMTKRKHTFGITVTGIIGAVFVGLGAIGMSDEGMGPLAALSAVIFGSSMLIRDALAQIFQRIVEMEERER